MPDFGQSEVAAVLEQLGYFDGGDGIHWLSSGKVTGPKATWVGRLEDGESITPAELREFLVVQCDLDGDVVRDAIAHALRSSG
ncbi:hypothetical protein O0235_05050 [Tepidiforma flava]|uniref:Uncharacterized protein n=1 Tax=Tepidiforma flava TaxID=3004094 RepID=A0ABY7M9J0_9CHLR|nr:hypothetical protein [Tepidiforma flava]WBL36932.1 hypothetical protein O0235_05050 [Tepidiforma flava]